MRNFVKIKSLRDGEITLSLTDIGKSCHCCEFITVANMSFNAIRKNKILSKISEFRRNCNLYKVQNSVIASIRYVNRRSGL